MKHLVLLLALGLVGCESRSPDPGNYPLDQLLQLGEVPWEWSQDNILYRTDLDWPTLPLVEGGWCRMDTLYWVHGVEADLNKDALVLDQVDKQWHLWLYSRSWDLGNDPLGGRHDSRWNMIHCLLNDEPHVLGEPPDQKLWLRYDMYHEHYDGTCQRFTPDWETSPLKAMVRLQGFGGKVTVSIGMPESLQPGFRWHDDGDDPTTYISGAWDEMGTCPWQPSAPIEDLQEGDRERVRKWAFSPLGKDARLGETAEQANARARSYILKSDEVRAKAEKLKQEAQAAQTQAQSYLKSDEFQEYGSGP